MALPRLLPVRQTTRCLTFVLLLCLMLRSANAYCTQGSEWIEYNGSCYQWSRSEVNWFSAELTCKKFGGHLVSIGSVSENKFLLRLTQCSAYYWIGMVNTVHSLKGQVRGYEWWDGSRHNFTALNPKTINYHDCVYSDMYGNWTNVQCQSSFSYVCMASAGWQGHGTDQQAQQRTDDGPKFGWWTGDYYTDPGTTVVENDTTYETATTETETPRSTWGSWTTEDLRISATKTDGTTLGPSTLVPEGTTQDPRSSDTDVTTTVPSTEYASTRIWPTTAPPSSTQSPTKCPPGWQLMDSSCYFVSEAKTNYFNAQMSCQAMGASVSSILTPREHTLLTVALGCHSPAWIGLEKTRPCVDARPNGRDYCWVWMDRSPFIYQGWARGGGNLNEWTAECAIIDGQWKVMHCHSEYRYICKKPAY